MKRVLLALAIILTFSAGRAFAGSATANVTVNASVGIPCSISGATISFGNYIAGQTGDLTSSANIGVQCATGVPYSVELNDGNAPLGYLSRQMGDGASNYLAYYLYQDTGLTTQWGTSADALVGSGNNAVQSLAIYSKILAGLFPVAGSYSDLVTATVFW